MEEALRGAAKANPSRGGAPRVVASFEGDEVSPELLPAPPRTGSSSPVPTASGAWATPPTSPSPQPQRSPGPVRLPATAVRVEPKRDAEPLPLPSSSPRKENRPTEAAAARPVTPRKETPGKPGKAEEPIELKESKSAYDSDLDGGSESEREVNILPTVLQQMTAAASPPASAERSVSPSRPARLEKTRGSVALPRGEALEKWGEGRAELKPEEKKKEGGKGEEGPAKPGGGLRRGLLSLLKLDGDAEQAGGGADEDEEPEMVISGPVNVSHQAHIGPNNLAEADALFKKPEEASKKRLSSPIRLLSMRGKSRQTVRDEDVGGGGAEEEEEEGGLVITGPTEVTHQGHVDAGVKLRVLFLLFSLFLTCAGTRRRWRT